MKNNTCQHLIPTGLWSIEPVSFAGMYTVLPLSIRTTDQRIWGLS